MHDYDHNRRVTAARRGDREALGELLKPVHRRLWGYLYRATGNPHDAEDLLQETYVRVIRAIGRYRDRGMFDAWVFTIASRVMIDHARRRRPVADGDVESIPASPRTRPDRRTMGRETADRIRAAVETLQPAQREVFLLRTERGLAFREIAATLGCPLGTALGRMRDAVRRLRCELSDLAPRQRKGSR